MFRGIRGGCVQVKLFEDIVWSWSTLFVIEASKTFQQTKKTFDFAVIWAKPSKR